MKYKILIMFLVMFLVTSCGKKATETITCTFENTNEGTEYTSVIVADVNSKGEVINATATNNYQDETLAKEICNNFSVASDSKNVTCEDKTITIKDYHKSLAGKNKLTKEDFIEHMENNKYTCK